MYTDVAREIRKAADANVKFARIYVVFVSFLIFIRSFVDYLHLCINSNLLLLHARRGDDTLQLRLPTALHTHIIPHSSEYI